MHFETQKIVETKLALNYMKHRVNLETQIVDIKEQNLS